MTTRTDTTDDLLRAVRENAEFREAFRREILTEDLLALPQRFAEYAAASDDRLSRIEALVAENSKNIADNSKNIAELTESMKAANRRLDDLEALVSENSKNIAALTERMEAADRRLDDLKALVSENSKNIAALTERMEAADRRLDDLKALVSENSKNIAELTERMEATDARFNRMQNDQGSMKGLLIEHIVREDAILTILDMNLTLVNALSRREVMQMWQDALHAGLTEGIPQGDRRSFARADLVMEAIDGDGEPCYIAVEASYVAHSRDVERAKRNARYLTRFTGRPAYAAVASVSLHDEVREDITQSRPLPFGGQRDYKTFWSELEEPTPSN